MASSGLPRDAAECGLAVLALCALAATTDAPDGPLAPEAQTLRELLDREGAGRYGIRLWMLVTRELWRRVVVEGEGV